MWEKGRSTARCHALIWRRTFVQSFVVAQRLFGIQQPRVTRSWMTNSVPPTSAVIAVSYTLCGQRIVMESLCTAIFSHSIAHSAAHTHHRRCTATGTERICRRMQLKEHIFVVLCSHHTYLFNITRYNHKMNAYGRKTMLKLNNVNIARSVVAQSMVDYGKLNSISAKQNRHIHICGTIWTRATDETYTLPHLSSSTFKTNFKSTLITIIACTCTLCNLHSAHTHSFQSDRDQSYVLRSGIAHVILHWKLEFSLNLNHCESPLAQCKLYTLRHRRLSTKHEISNSNILFPCFILKTFSENIQLFFFVSVSVIFTSTRACHFARLSSDYY